jgi:multidrug efflux pump subunit AcrB
VRYRTRVRPVLMTAAAMVVDMIAMAIGGGVEEQNAESDFLPSLRVATVAPNPGTTSVT